MLIWHNPIPDAWPTPKRVEIARGIRAGMPVEPVWELDTYRWRNDDGDESSAGATFAANEVTNLTDVDVSSDVDYRLRIAIDQTDVTATSNAKDPDIVPRLEAKLNSGGTWAAVPNDGAGSYVEMDSGSGLSDGGATTNHGLTLDHTFRSGGTQEENSSDAGTITLTDSATGSYIGEWAITLLSSGLSDGDVVYFRVTDAGTLLDAYQYGDASDTNPITITVTKGAGTDIVKVRDEACGPDEVPTTALVLNRIISEVEDISEALVSARILSRIISEVLDISEGQIYIKAIVQVLSETLNLAEDTLYIVSGALVKVISETLDIIEQTLFRRKRRSYEKRIVAIGY